MFISDRILQLHLRTVHQVGRQPRNQLTVTATSLLPYFKLETAHFYDSEGQEYKIGKKIDKDTELAKHLHDKLVEPGSRVENIKGDCFLVQLIDHSDTSDSDDNNLVILNRRELEKCCGRDGKLKELYTRDQMVFEDCPVLQRQC